jgi:hypothetical protein
MLHNKTNTTNVEFHFTMSASDNNNNNKSNAEKAAKKARKVALKAEAESMGITYDELKERKKRNKKREAEQLENVEHQTDMKRMRTWSKDFDDPTTKKRNITRSMDETLLANEKETPEISLSAEEWRCLHDIKVQGHGTASGQKEKKKFPDPFLKFSDAPFCAAIQKSFSQAGFDKPTHIQSQVRTVTH